MPAISDRYARCDTFIIGETNFRDGILAPQECRDRADWKCEGCGGDVCTLHRRDCKFGKLCGKCQYFIDKLDQRIVTYIFTEKYPWKNPSIYTQPPMDESIYGVECYQEQPGDRVQEQRNKS